MPEVTAWMWIAWAAASLGIFALLETVALINKRDNDTLSENIRRWLGIVPSRPIRRIAIPLFATTLIVFVGWFLPHILINVWPAN